MVRMISILSDDLTNPVPLEQVVIASMANQNYISPIMAELSEKLPLPSRLQHLKRVRRLQVILVPIRTIIEDLDQPCSVFWSFLLQRPRYHQISDKDVYLKILMDGPNLSNLSHSTHALDYMKFKGIPDHIIELFGEPSAYNTVEVAQVQPMLRWQFDLVSQNWPCKFHLNKTIEDQYGNTVYSATELSFHCLIMDVLLFVRNQTGVDCSLAIDPLTKHIVGLGVCAVDIHPLMHSPMVLIDAVARSQGAGAWNEFARNALPLHASSKQETASSDASYSLCFAGVDEAWRRNIQEEFPQVKFGAQIAVNREQPGSGDSEASSEKSGPYLCTGYDVYLMREPCIMCAMALVHSRARTVFYKEAHQRGGLGSIVKVHTLKALNHHYRTYQMVE